MAKVCLAKAFLGRSEPLDGGHMKERRLVTVANYREVTCRGKSASRRAGQLVTFRRCRSRDRESDSDSQRPARPPASLPLRPVQKLSNL